MRWSSAALIFTLVGLTSTAAARRGAKDCNTTANSNSAKQPTLTSDPARFKAAYPSLHTMFDQYVALHAAAMVRLRDADAAGSAASLASERYVVAVLQGGGWGNRLPSLFVAAALALRTNRTLLVAWRQDYLAHAAIYKTSLFFDSPLDFDYHQHEAKLAPLMAHAMQFLAHTEPAMNFNFDNVDSNPMWTVATVDNLMPLLQVNPSMMPFFQQHFPFGEVTAPLSKLLLALAAPIRSLVDSFTGRNFKDRFAIGIQLRSAKFAIDDSVYFNLAKRIAQQQGLSPDSVAFFIAADSAAGYESAVRALGPAGVCWTDNGVGEVTNDQDHNPGTESSGLVDMYLLSHCDALIVTRSSSFGNVAGALGYRHSYVVWGKTVHNLPQALWVTPSLTLEPVYFSAQWVLDQNRTAELAQFKALPGWMHHVQGHHKSWMPCVQTPVGKVCPP